MKSIESGFKRSQAITADNQLSTISESVSAGSLVPSIFFRIFSEDCVPIKFDANELAKSFTVDVKRGKEDCITIRDAYRNGQWRVECCEVCWLL